MLVNRLALYFFSSLLPTRVFLFSPSRAWGRGEAYENAVLCSAKIEVEMLENLGAREAASGS